MKGHISSPCDACVRSRSYWEYVKWFAGVGRTGWELSVSTGLSCLKFDLFPLLKARPVIMSDILDSLRTYLLFNTFTSLESRAAIFFPRASFLFYPHRLCCVLTVLLPGDIGWKFMLGSAWSLLFSAALVFWKEFNIPFSVSNSVLFWDNCTFPNQEWHLRMPAECAFEKSLKLNKLHPRRLLSVLVLCHRVQNLEGLVCTCVNGGKAWCECRATVSAKVVYVWSA